MSTQVVEINKKSLDIKEYKGERVITFKEVDSVHERPHGTASRNFRENKKFFIQDEDFYELKGEELSNIKQATNFVGRNARSLILLTETGYLMLVKSFTDKLAWQVQRQLVNNYFRVKQEPTQLSIEPEIRKKTYKGIPVMVFEDLAHILGLSRDTAYWRVRQNNIPHIVLQGKKLVEFKAENHSFASQAKSLAILYYEDVLTFCKILDLETDIVDKYFEGATQLKSESNKKTHVPTDEDYKKAEFMLKASQNLQDKKMANFVAIEALKMIAGERIVEDYDIAVVLNRVIQMTKGKSLNQIKAMKKDAEEMMGSENASNEVKEFMKSVFDRAILQKLI